uniref:FI07211p n=2 Tax=Drosophila melanogaster TaxID=7227 RepID=Q0E8R1_DROME|eukprot:NP_723746.1 virus-induced RNA 1, isoform A [Drosophila melanogaster]
MKLLFGLLMTVLALSGVFTLPARNDPQDDAEVIKVPSRPQPESDFHNFRGVIDTGSGYPFLQPNPSSFNVGIFDSFDDLFRRLRTRLWPVIGRDSGEEGASPTGDSDDSSDGSGAGFPFGVRPLIPLDSKNANTTSTIKVVNGHKVEINETVYGDSNSVFKVRLVNVRPLESGEEVAQGVHTSGGDFQPALEPSTSAPPKKFEEFDEEDDDDRREPLEKQPQDNEVRDIDEPKSTTPTNTSYTTNLHTSAPIDSEFEASDISEDIVETQPEEQKNTMDQLQQMMEPLREEIRHEEDLEQEHEDKEYLERKEKKEREEFDSSDDEDGEATTPVVMSETFNDEWAEFDQDQDREHDRNEDQDHDLDFENDLNNEIDIEENFVPIDLSNDIAVNDLAAADPNFPINEDAEFIVHPAVIRTMPMFEKLSLGEPAK